LFVYCLVCIYDEINGIFIIGYASTGAGAGAGVYNSYTDQNYGGKYPYSNRYQGYQGGFPYYQAFAPLPPIPSPWDYQNAFNQYFSQVNQNIAKYETDFFKIIFFNLCLNFFSVIVKFFLVVQN
jgi:hypothetical protein